MLGRSYHRRYGYPWRYATPAEIGWRLEHITPYRGGDGGVFGCLTGFGMRMRYRFERLGGEAAGTR